MKQKWFIPLWVLTAALLASCSATRFVPEGEYLLQSYKIECDNKAVDESQLSSFVRQKPNKTIFGMRFHLWLYNRADPNKTNKWNEWLRKNGEEPVIWTQSKTDISREQLRIRLREKGYYYPTVKDTVKLKHKRAEVTYLIKTGKPYIVDSVSYEISDTAIRKIVNNDAVHSQLYKGMLLDESTIDKERIRIEMLLKEHGYYSFAKGLVLPFSDTTFANYKATLKMVIRPNKMLNAANKEIETPYPRYTIRSLSVNAGMNLQDFAGRSAVMPDTFFIGPIKYIMAPHFPVKASTINRQIYIYPDSLFRQSSFNETSKHLQSLRNFTRTTHEFHEVPDSTNSLMRELDCTLSLLPSKRQSFSIEALGTNSEGNFGGELSLQATNLSLFGHAEILNLHLRGMIEAVSATQNAFKIKTAMEYEAEASLNVPKFLLPLHLYGFTRRFNPKTAFSLLYNYQRRPQYTRSIFNTSMGYNWQGSATVGRYKGANIIFHTVRPVDINYVKLQDVADDYMAYLEKYPYLKNSYQTHLVVSSRYTFIRDLQQPKKDNFFFVRANFETAGLLLNTFFKMADKDKKTDSSTPYEILNNPFSQFVKTDMDLRYYHTINNNNHLVSRLFVGVGLPYGNSRTYTADGRLMASMPFEKKYYSGGSLSMRGWRMRSLGPGSYKDSVSVSAYPNNTGDIKLEMNLEYRFKLVSIIEGAFFIDAGNIWDSHKDERRPGADFEFKRFYREMALDAGIGLRFDFKFFLLCFDTGIKLIDPAGNRGWVFNNKPDRPRLFNMSIGIGYPL